MKRPKNENFEKKKKMSPDIYLIYNLTQNCNKQTHKKRRNTIRLSHYTFYWAITLKYVLIGKAL